MSKRIKNRKGKLGRDAKHNKQFAREGSSGGKFFNNLPSGTPSGYPWWISFHQPRIFRGRTI